MIMPQLAMNRVPEPPWTQGVDRADGPRVPADGREECMRLREGRVTR